MEARRGVPGEGDSRDRSRISTRESFRFLTRAGQALAASLDYDTTLQRVAELAVPRVACYCIVDVVEAGRVRRVGMAHSDPDKLDVLRRTAEFPLQLSAGSLLSEVLRGGEPLLRAVVTDDALREVSQSEEHLALLRALAPTSWILSPLIVQDRALGAILFASTRPERRYERKDLALARELARSAALAIDNARVHRLAEEAARAREDVLQHVSHDLRNPLAAVSMASSLLLEVGAAELGEEKFGLLLRTIHRASEQATHMIDDLLDVSRIEAGKLAIDAKPEPVASMLTEALDLHRPLAEKRGVHLELCATEELPPVLADRLRVLRVLGNLLGNAIKFTPSDGRIEIGATADEHEVHFWVMDTGPGIPPDQVPHLFDRFWQARRTDRRGLGLGLAIVKGIVEAHRGRLWVASVIGKGTRFDFTLPRVR